MRTLGSSTEQTKRSFVLKLVVLWKYSTVSGVREPESWVKSRKLGERGGRISPKRRGEGSADGAAPKRTQPIASKRNLCHQIQPLIRAIVRPDRDQRLRNVPHGRMPRDDQQNTGAIATQRDERRQSPRHRALIVADENPALLGGAPQYRFVVQMIQSGNLGPTQE